MQHVKNMSIARESFMIEDPAMKLLDSYMERAGRQLANNPDKDEVLADIEVAISERLKKATGKKVVDLPTMQSVLNMVGEVKDGEPDEKPENTSPKTFWEKAKKYMQVPIARDTNREIISGVCAGIARRFDIDPLFIRAGFVLLAIMTDGAIIFLYIVLIIIMQDDTKVFSAQDLAGKTTRKLKPYEEAFKKLFSFVFRVARGAMMAIVSLVLMVLGAFWMMILFRYIQEPASMPVLGPQVGWLEVLFVVSAGLVIFVPLMQLLLALFGRKVRQLSAAGSWSIWVLSFMVLIAAGFSLWPKAEDYLIREQPNKDWIRVKVVDGELTDFCIGHCPEPFSELIANLPGKMIQVYAPEDFETYADDFRWESRTIDIPSVVTSNDYWNIVIEFIISDYGVNNVLLPEEPPVTFTTATEDLSEPVKLKYFVLRSY